MSVPNTTYVTEMASPIIITTIGTQPVSISTSTKSKTTTLTLTATFVATQTLPPDTISHTQTLEVKTTTLTSIQTTTVAATPCTPTSGDMIINGGFEADDVGWSFYQHGNAGETAMSEILGTATNPTYDESHEVGCSA
ncbi:hypothetical protein BDZ45DRAFT_731997 [Acephala macrosclerotiorum]|nr:hypothetical protein BDZ45DRAFT_731997 [Acephala macrosclerotiorum]